MMDNLFGLFEYNNFRRKYRNLCSFVIRVWIIRSGVCHYYSTAERRGEEGAFAGIAEKSR